MAHHYNRRIVVEEGESSRIVKVEEAVDSIAVEVAVRSSEDCEKTVSIRIVMRKSLEVLRVVVWLGWVLLRGTSISSVMTLSWVSRHYCCRRVSSRRKQDWVCLLSGVTPEGASEVVRSFLWKAGTVMS